MTGRVTVISGGTSGIGEECVRLFARRGDRVVFTGTSEQKAAAVTASLQKDRLEKDVRFLKTDITREPDVQRLAGFVTETFGPCEVLVNNAGILVSGAVHETSIEDWDRLFAVNVTGTYLCCKHFVPAMLKNGRGVIVNTASISGMLGEYNMAAYCATKGAICNLTHAMALDYADAGIRVNAVCPGATRTSMFVTGTDDAFKKKCEQLFPPRRVGLPEEVAAAVFFLASEEARFINGVLLPVDGGISAHTGQPRQDKGEG
jgi:meso-butanediol dehydrogenase/(S,S)-butanediol dehydrogenase/diacetyl reductase